MDEAQSRIRNLKGVQIEDLELEGTGGYYPGDLIYADRVDTNIYYDAILSDSSGAKAPYVKIKGIVANLRVPGISCRIENRGRLLRDY
jgi:hypothetical protein